MRAEVRKWGNSLAIRIPRAFAEETRLNNGTRVDLKLQSGRLVISPLRKKHYDLSALLARVGRAKKHPVIDWGATAGGEAW